tara:strand:+ start:352 stop:471 length:120 start_codon:yes stop_codon:yes gene_type:complete
LDKKFNRTKANNNIRKLLKIKRWFPYDWKNKNTADKNKK